VRVAAIDIGTNSVLLLVAEVGSDGSLRRLVDRATITRLGQGVDRSGELASEAVARTLACIDDYADEIREHGVDIVGAVGTSAMRDARGSDAFVAGFEQRVGVVPEVISGRREAELTFDGALTGLTVHGNDEGRVAVFDVGGGSTEIIVGHAQGGTDGRIDEAISLDVGAVRLTERHVATDPPTAHELEAIRRDVRAALADAPELTGIPLVGVAGTVTTVAAVVGGLQRYEPDTVHGCTITEGELADCVTRLAAVDLAARRQVPGLDPGRADVIIAGALIVDEVRDKAQARALVVSDRGVRYGLAKELAVGRRAPKET